VEFTHGVNGYHPHLHLVLIYNEATKASEMLTKYESITWKRFGRLPVGTPSLALGERPLTNPLDPEWDDGGQYRAMRGQLFELWEHAVRSKLDRQIGNAGVDVTPVRDDHGIGSYVSKIQYELARGDLKCGRGRSGSRSLFQIAVDAAMNGDKRDAAIWAKYVEVTRGAKVISIGRELRERYLKNVELTDQEIVDQAVEGDEEVKFDRDVFKAIDQYKPHDLKSEVITVYELRGLEAVIELLNRTVGPVQVADDDESGLPLVSIPAPVVPATEALPGNVATSRAALERFTKRLRAEASDARWEWLREQADAMRATAPVTADPSTADLRGQYRPDMTADEFRQLERQWDAYLYAPRTNPTEG